MTQHRSCLPLAVATLGVILFPGCAAPPATARAVTHPAERRVIVVSVDAFNEGRVRSSLPAESTRAIRAVIDGGSCAAARVAFPSLTSPGHAALWTGAYGDVSGISGNVQSLLPQDAHTVAETGSGFSSRALRAEPLWVTAALHGVRTVGHHATQTPAPAGYPPVRSDALEPALARLRVRADSAARLALLHMVNGYDEHVTPDLLITHEAHRPRRVPPWAGAGAGAYGEGSMPPLEVAVPFGQGTDSIFILFTGREGQYTEAWINGSRTFVGAVTARPHPAEETPVLGRELARHFSPSFTARASGRAVRVRARLFELTRDASQFMLFVPGTSVMASNHQSTAAGYDAATGGWVGNSASSVYARGGFGTPLTAGGDGTAELRWLESAELATRTSIAGAEWMWKTLGPRLMLDYFAIGDDTDHLFWGLAAAPGVDPEITRRANAVRARAWSIVDTRVGALHALARDAGAALVLTGDHGMRPYWRLFRPNVALAEAGLLTVDSAGRIVPARSRAVSPNGYWITVNRTGWRDGTVSDARTAGVIDSVVDVLTRVRGHDGAKVVTAVYRATEHDSLGIGGPAGGDVYFELAPGYYYNAAATGPATEGTAPRGGHGYPSVAPDMSTVLCFTGPDFGAKRLAPQRTIDMGPTVLEWLGAALPPTARGRSLLPELHPRE